MSHDIMIDLETLSTTADAAILSIGAVSFDLEAGIVFDNVAALGTLFYTAISIDSQPERAITGSTLAWWMDQTKDTQSVFTDPNMMGLEFALGELEGWLDSCPGAKPTVWSNGADFDLPMLAHAYKQFGWTPPWKPYAARCYRTYKNLPGARAIQVERTGQHHNALANPDAPATAPTCTRVAPPARLVVAVPILPQVPYYRNSGNAHIPSRGVAC